MIADILKELEQQLKLLPNELFVDLVNKRLDKALKTYYKELSEFDDYLDYKLEKGHLKSVSKKLF